MVSDAAGLGAINILVIPTIYCGIAVWHDDITSQALSRAVDVGYLLSSLTVTSGQLTTSALPSAHLCRTFPRGCLRETIARILLI